MISSTYQQIETTNLSLTLLHHCVLTEKKHTFYIINDKWSKNKVQSYIS